MSLFARLDTSTPVIEATERDKTGKVSCGVFIPIPFQLAKHFPDKSDEDDSVPHMTLLYIGEVTPEEQSKVVAAVMSTARDWPPFRIDVFNYDEFENGKGQTIAHMAPHAIIPVRSSCGTTYRTLGQFHADLFAAVEATGVKVGHTYGKKKVSFGARADTFKSHATLAYINKGEPEYAGPKPKGSFPVTAIEVWGWERYQIPLGRTTADQPALGNVEVRAPAIYPMMHEAFAPPSDEKSKHALHLMISNRIAQLCGHKVQMIFPHYSEKGLDASFREGGWFKVRPRGNQIVAQLIGLPWPHSHWLGVGGSLPEALSKMNSRAVVDRTPKGTPASGAAPAAQSSGPSTPTQAPAPKAPPKEEPKAAPTPAPKAPESKPEPKAPEPQVAEKPATTKAGQLKPSFESPVPPSKPGKPQPGPEMETIGGQHLHNTIGADQETFDRYAYALKMATDLLKKRGFGFLLGKLPMNLRNTKQNGLLGNYSGAQYKVIQPEVEIFVNQIDKHAPGGKASPESIALTMIHELGHHYYYRESPRGVRKEYGRDWFERAWGPGGSPKTDQWTVTVSKGDESHEIPIEAPGHAPPELIGKHALKITKASPEWKVTKIAPPVSPEKAHAMQIKAAKAGQFPSSYGASQKFEDFPEIFAAFVGRGTKLAPEHYNLSPDIMARFRAFVAQDKRVDVRSEQFLDDDALAAITEGKIPPKELRMGMEIEKEHSSDPKETAKLALDHLKDNLHYYSKLRKCGLGEAEGMAPAPAGPASPAPQAAAPETTPPHPDEVQPGTPEEQPPEAQQPPEEQFNPVHRHGHAVVVGVEHGKPINLHPDTIGEIQQHAKHGVHHEGAELEGDPAVHDFVNQHLGGQSQSWELPPPMPNEHRWHPELALSLFGGDTDQLHHQITTHDNFDPSKSIHDNLLSTADAWHHPATGAHVSTHDLNHLVKSIADDPAASEVHPEAKDLHKLLHGPMENFKKFHKVGFDAAFPQDSGFHEHHTKISRMADMANAARDAHLAHQMRTKGGVYFAGKDHVPAVAARLARKGAKRLKTEGVSLFERLAGRLEESELPPGSQLTEARASCMDCTRKHLAQALVLMGEAKQGYPDHRWIAIGHLAEAGDESVLDRPELAAEIRKHRVAYMRDPNYVVPVMELIKKAGKGPGCGAQANEQTDLPSKYGTYPTGSNRTGMGTAPLEQPPVPVRTTKVPARVRARVFGNGGSG